MATDEGESFMMKSVNCIEKDIARSFISTKQFIETNNNARRMRDLLYTIAVSLLLRYNEA